MIYAMHDNGFYGKGIYFAKSSLKSDKYATQNSEVKVMLLNYVNLG